MDPDIRRIDGYSDDRFSRTVLLQHGAYLVSGEPYEIEITGADSAVIRGRDPGVYRALIEYFRFHAPHIVDFRDAAGAQAASFPPEELVEIELDRIQPSQFFVDEEKLRAVASFIRAEQDIVIQALRWDDRYISLDGHTRLYLAVQRGYRRVRAVVSETDDWVWAFVHEARRRNVLRPGDLTLLPHEQYELQWNRYCDRVFAEEAQPSPSREPARSGPV